MHTHKYFYAYSQVLLRVFTSTSTHTHKYFYAYSQVLLSILTGTSTRTYKYFYMYLCVLLRILTCRSSSSVHPVRHPEAQESGPPSTTPGVCSRTHLHVLTSTYKYLYVYLRVIPPPLFIQFVIQQHKSLVLRQPPLVCVAEPIYTYLQILTSTSMHTYVSFLILCSSSSSSRRTRVWSSVNHPWCV